MKIKALGNQVIVKQDAAAEKTEAGIVIVNDGREKPTVGTVLAVGPGLTSELTGNLLPMSLTKGQRVVFMKFGGFPIAGLERVLVISEREILAVIDEGEEIG